MYDNSQLKRLQWFDSKLYPTHLNCLVCTEKL